MTPDDHIPAATWDDSLSRSHIAPAYVGKHRDDSDWAHVKDWLRYGHRDADRYTPRHSAAHREDTP